MPAQWFCCDVLDTPVDLNETADLVYTGQGAINWIHDIGAWANVIARLLRQGGVLSLLEDHPASWLFSQESERLEASGLNYFAHAEASQGWTDEYIGNLGKPAVQHATKHERLWTIADVFQALVKAGLTVEYLGEHPEEYWSAFPKLNDREKSKIPMTYSIIARKLK
jgi:SAM-dependent methyltransferase